mgnify:CR=1 FL=1
MAEGARLESVYTATYRGFESLSHRQTKKPRQRRGFFVWLGGVDENPASAGFFMGKYFLMSLGLSTWP